MTGHSSGHQPNARARLAGERAVVLSLGSNLGDRMANLQLGVDVLVAGGLFCAAVSGVFETAPVGGPEQADYLNARAARRDRAACERHAAPVRRRGSGGRARAHRALGPADAGRGPHHLR